MRSPTKKVGKPAASRASAGNKMDQLVSGIQVGSRPSYSRERNLRRQQAVTIQQNDYTGPPASALSVAMGALHRLVCALVVSYLSPRTVRALSAPSSRAKRQSLLQASFHVDPAAIQLKVRC